MNPLPSVSWTLAAAAVCWLLTTTPARADQSPTHDDDEATLHKAGIRLESAALLTFLRRQGGAGADDDLAGIDRLLRDLGASTYQARTGAADRLVAIGPAALPRLRRQAREASDPEVVRSAQRCSKRILANWDYTLHRACVRLLARRTPPGTAAAFLHHLPYVVDEEVEADVWYALDRLARRGTDPGFANAVRDRFPARRAVAGFVLGRYGNEQQRGAARALLDDAEATVRLRVAQGLLGARDKAAVPVLIGLVDQPSVALAWQAEELLHYTAGKGAPRETVGAGSAAARAACRRAWEDWWRGNGAKLDLKDRTGLPRMPGLVLLSSHDRTRVALSGCNGPHRWQLPLKPQTIDLSLLPGDRLLIAQMKRYERIREKQELKETPGGIYECDLAGNVLWEYKGLPDPMACRRLPNGNTLIIDPHTSQTFLTDQGFKSVTEGVVEVNPEGKRVFQRHTKGYNENPLKLAYPVILGNGRLCYLQGESNVTGFAEVDPRTGEDVSRLTYLERLPRGVGFDPLGNGRYLLSLPFDQGVREIDAGGNTVWSYSGRADEARRLRNGNTLISRWCDGSQILEVTPDHRIVWRAVATVGPSLHPCLPLVKLGFDGTD